MRLSLALFVGLLCLGSIGCDKNLPGPRLSSSAGEPGYAAGYPQRVQRVIKSIDESEASIKKIDSGFAAYPDEFSNPPWDVVLSVMEHADEAGRSRSYANERRDAGTIKAFFDEDGQEVARKAAGAAAYAAKQKGCDADVGGPVAHAVKEGVDKQLEKRLRSHNDAQRLVESYRDTLGKKNASVAEKDADEIAEASYQANVALVEARLELHRLVEEAGAVRSSLQNAINSEKTFQGEAGRTEPEKQASKQRQAALEKAQTEIDGVVAEGQKLEQDIEKRVENDQKEYTQAFANLRQAIRDKQQQQKK